MTILPCKVGGESCTSKAERKMNYLLLKRKKRNKIKMEIFNLEDGWTTGGTSEDKDFLEKPRINVHH